MSKKDRKKETLASSNDGTAARVRPLSFEEIMSKRKNKLATDDRETINGSKKNYTQDDPKLSDLSGPYRADKSFKNGKEKIREISKKKEEYANKEHSEGKDKAKLEANVDVKHSHSRSNKDKERKNEKHNHHKNSDRERMGAGSNKENDSKRQKHDSRQDKLEERGNKLKSESKRKDHDFVDAKSRLESDVLNSRRHDFGKTRHSEYTERYDKKSDISKHYHEKPKSKRRKSRSRSRENDRERDRSTSLSPRAHKRVYRGHDYEDALPYHHREKSRKKYSDGDKHKGSGNGEGYESGHHRKYGSGLGGYSPRKRRSEAAARTPSPVARSPEKKTSTWDQPPTETIIAATGQLPSNFQPSSSKIYEVPSVPVTPAVKTSQSLSSVDIATVVSASIDSIQLTQATRPMRRLCIENLPASASEKTMIDCLNEFLLSTGANHIKGTTPCISCMINKDKSQAIVEFLTLQDATTALSFDGRSFSGSILKIRRPKDFVETTIMHATWTERGMHPPLGYNLVNHRNRILVVKTHAETESSEKLKEEVNVLSNVVKDSPHKIFVAGFPKSVSSNMLMEIVSAFGTLKAYHFDFNEELREPCAFIEYADHSVNSRACAGLNGMKLGGQVLTAVQALPYCLEEENVDIVPCYDVPVHAKPLLSAATKVLQLKNLLNRDEFFLLSEDELEEFLDDIRLECTRFGTVKSVNIVKYSINPETAAEHSKLCPDEDSAILEPKGSPSSPCEKTSDMPLPFHESEPNAVKDDAEDIISKVAMSTEGNEKQYAVNSTDIFKEDLYPRDASIEFSGIAVNNVKEPGGEDGLVSEPPKLENMDIEVEDDPPINDSVALKEVCTSNDDKMALDFTSLNTKRSISENTNLDSRTIAKAEAAEEVQSLYEPGCVLVEYLREEASCIAAHSLHGRAYGDHVVMAGFFPHDLYLARFQK